LDSLAEDQRPHALLTPFVGFLEVTKPDFEPAENIHRTATRNY
jgi:hypothetical protein